MSVIDGGWGVDDVLVGTDQDDSIDGHGGNDTIDGGAGDDTIVTYEGSDTIHGGDGDDYINMGTGGADIAYGGAGDDVFQGDAPWTDTQRVVELYGEAGDDQFLLNDSTYGGIYYQAYGGDGVDEFTVSSVQVAWIVGGAGDDVVTLADAYGSLTLGDGHDRVRVTGGHRGSYIYDFQVSGASSDTLDISSYLHFRAPTWDTTTNPFATGYLRLVQSDADTWLQVDRDGGADSFQTLVIFQDVQASSLTAANLSGMDPLGGAYSGVTLVGGAGVDVLYGTIRDDVLRGGDGDDRLDGGQGSDTLEGGAGDDQLSSASGEDKLYGGDGADYLSMWRIGTEPAGHVALDGGAGDDLIVVVLNGTGQLQIDGGDGDDTISLVITPSGAVANGGAGDDLITASTSNDILDGGTNAAHDALGVGGDTIRFNEYSAHTVDLEIQTAQNTGGSAVDVLMNFENIIGGGMGDILRGTAGSNTIDGNTGNDYIEGRGGDDWLFGGTYYDFADGGQDVLVGGEGNDYLDGGGNIDTASYWSAPGGVTVSLALAGAQNTGGAGIDTLVSIENLAGSAYTDVLYGDGGANRLDGNGGSDGMAGGGGDDVIDGGAGADYMVGGAGNDSYIVDDLYDTIVEAAGEGVDVVYASTSYGLGANVEVLYLGAAGDSNGVGNDLGNTLIGDSHNNYLSGLGGNDALLGGDGADHAFGGDGEDYLYGQNGDDWLVGDAGFDHLYGEAGIDVLIGGAGDDLMAGGVGDDGYVVDSATDLIVENAGEGADVVYAYASYTLAANVENLWLFDGANGGSGNASDNLLVANLNVGSTLYGQAGADALVGENGDDFLYGGLDNDFLNGQAGADTLVGGQGSDLLYGGTGADTFLYAAVSDSIGAAGNMDAILDFEVGIDKVNLHGVLGGVGDSVSLLTNGDGTYILVDLAGDGSEDMRILLYHTTGVTMSDLML